MSFAESIYRYLLLMNITEHRFADQLLSLLNLFTATIHFTAEWSVSADFIPHVSRWLLCPSLNLRTLILTVPSPNPPFSIQSAPKILLYILNDRLERMFTIIYSFTVVLPLSPWI